MLEILRKIFSYNEWATLRSLNSVENLSDSKARQLLSHTLLAKKIWLTRLKGEASSAIPTFQEFSLSECAEISVEIHRAYIDFLDSLKSEDLETSITYKNTKGKEFHTSVKDILLHVAMHGAYHRGQIALSVKENGGEAAQYGLHNFYPSMNLNQVTIYSKKPVETVEFYQKLGLKVIVDSLPRYARLLCPDGNATLSIHIAEEVSPNSNIVLYFECEDLDAKVAELENLGLQFETRIQDQTWLWRETYLTDPNSNNICLFCAGENRQNPPWRVK